MTGKRSMGWIAGVLLVWACSDVALGQYHAGVGRFLQRDPIVYRDGLNLYEFVRGRPTNYLDPIGLEWVYMGSDNYCAMAETDTRASLAEQLGYPAADGMCTWPVKTAVKNLEDVRQGDIYNVSNLMASFFGPKLYVDMQDPMHSLSLLYRKARPGAISAITGVAVENAIIDASGEGDTPISYFEINAEGGKKPFVASTPTSKQEDAFEPGRTGGRDEPAETYERAAARKGPRRCWFSRHATARAISCHGSTFGKRFAQVYLRSPARIYTSKTGELRNYLKRPI